MSLYLCFVVAITPPNYARVNGYDLVAALVAAAGNPLTVHDNFKEFQWREVRYLDLREVNYKRKEALKVGGIQSSDIASTAQIKIFAQAQIAIIKMFDQVVV